jgi:hypothetical protein
MLLHEHFSYFTRASLTRTLAAHGWSTFDARLAGYGGAIYAASRPEVRIDAPAHSSADLREAQVYGDKCRQLVATVAQRVESLAEAGKSLGIYCPARGLAILPLAGPYRFFDDDADLTGRYYPPFDAPVENRAALLARPVDELWILSRTFGQRLATALQPDLPATVIRLPDELARPEGLGGPMGQP